MEQKDEQSLIDSCKASKFTDFGPLYDRYCTPIYRFIYYRTLDRQTAEDLTSQTFLKALERIGTFDSSRGTFSAWLYGIARNTVTDHFRTSHPTENIDELADTWDFPFDGDDPAKATDAALSKEQIREGLKKLTPQQRDIILMRLWDGLSYKEIAQITGKSEGNCKVIYSRTVAKLRQELSPLALALILMFPLLP